MASRHRLWYSKYVLIAIIIFLSVNLCSTMLGEISTSECAWTIIEGLQGRVRSGASVVPAGPCLLYSRTFGSEGRRGFSFTGIGQGDLVVLTSEGEVEDEHKLIMIGSDGRVQRCHNVRDLWGETIDNQHVYLAKSNIDREMILSCRTLDGVEMWRTRIGTAAIVPVNHKGLVTIGMFAEYTGTMKVFDEAGNLVCEDRCADNAAFDAGGFFVWATSGWDFDPWGGAQVTYRACSETNREGAQFHSRYYQTVEYYPPYWSEEYAKVNAMGQVLVSGERMIALFEDTALSEILWSHHLEGYTVYENACGDPMGGWYVVHAEPQGEDDYLSDAKIMITRIERDGSRSWNKILQWTESYPIASYPFCICDAEGSVYIALGGEVLSYSPDGSERWRIRLAENDVRLLAMDSRGTLYVKKREADDPRLFALSSSPPHHSRIRVKLPQRLEGDVYSAGEELVVLLQPYNFGEDETVDAYMALIVPGGSLFFWTGDQWSASPMPLFTDIYMPNSFEMIDAPLSLGTIPEYAPEGTYTLIPGFCQPGTLTPVDELFPLTFEVHAD